MLVQSSAVNPIGLNGFFGNLWGSFKRALGLRYDNPERGFGSRLGGFLGKILKTFLDTSTAGAWSEWTSPKGYPTDGSSPMGKLIDYEPTAQEIAILNPIVAAINNFAIELTDKCDAVLKSNTSVQNQLAAFNNAIRQLQLLRDYYASYPLSTLSVQAQDKLAVEIDVLVKTFEATIEDVLDNNGVAYQKVQSYLGVNASDVMPIAIPNNLQATGVQYRVDSGDTMPLLTDVPTRANTTAPVQVAPVNSTTTEVVTGTGNANSTKTIAIVVIVAALIAAFTSSKKSKNES